MDELRKLQQTPTGTFFICLPRSWAKRLHLKKGDLILLNETNDGRLFINPNHEPNKLPKIAILKSGPFLSREIIGRYLLGFDIISIEAKENFAVNARSDIKKTVDSLIGLEIFEETYSKIVLQCLLQPSGFPPERILRRVYDIIAGMNRDAVDSFIHGDLQLANSVVARDDDSNRLYFLLVRILRTIIQNPILGEKLGVSSIDCLDYRLAAILIETIGDLSVKTALKTLELNNSHPSKDLQKLIQTSQIIVFEAHKHALASFLNKDIILAEKVRNLSLDLNPLFIKIEDTSKNSPISIIPQILATTSFMRQTYENAVDLADLVV